MTCDQKNKGCLIYREDFSVGPGKGSHYASLICGCGKFICWIKKPANGESDLEMAEKTVNERWEKFHSVTTK